MFKDSYYLLSFCPSNSQKYIQEKIGPDETTPWVQGHITKGFEGNIALSALADIA